MGDRKARLAALAARAGRTKKPDEAVTEGEPGQQDVPIEETKQQSVVFRNYAPNDKSLVKGVRNGDEEGGSPPKRQRVEGDKPMSSSSALENALLEAKQEIAASNKALGKSTEDDNVTAPKKINWDLKRDIQDKLDKLEKRTQKAIVEMLKERLEKEATEEAEDSDLD